MKNLVEEMIYEAPIVEIIEVEVEKGFAASPSNVEDPIEKTPGSWN